MKGHTGYLRRMKVTEHTQVKPIRKGQIILMVGTQMKGARAAQREVTSDSDKGLTKMTNK